MAGHVLMGRGNGSEAVINAACPGDVSVRMAYGIVRRGPYRTATFMRSVRSVVALMD
jgi:hypothetical protein